MKSRVARTCAPKVDAVSLPALSALVCKTGIALLALALCWSMSMAGESAAVPPGLSAPAKPTALPAFDLPTVDGSTFRSESLKGQVVIVRYWASW